jgi:hypothetical protein
MKNFFIWMQKDEGWKSIMAIIYAAICIFDFIVVPSWIGVNRKDISMDLITGMTTIDPSVQIELIKAAYHQHEPFTLQGGGLFHLAFGALLTGSALSSIKAGKT